MRIKFDEHFWFENVTAWKKSALSQENWCQIHNLKTTTFSGWKRKFYPSLSIKDEVSKVFPQARRIFLFHEPINIHHGFDKLYEIINTIIPSELFDFSFFVFVSKRRHYMKIFYLDQNNANILFIRKDRGTFIFNKNFAEKIGDFFIL